MKKIALITLIIFITLIASLPIANTGSQKIIRSYENYNLNEMGYSSNSTVKIGLLNRDTEFFNSNYNATSDKYPFYISGSNYYNTSGIYFSTDTDNLSINLSWNENESYSMTESYFKASYEGQSISGCFGLKYGSYISIIQGKNVDKLVRLSQNTFYKLSFIYSGKYVIFMINRMNMLCYSNSFMSNSDQKISKNINLTIQGYYYNLLFQKPALQHSRITIYQPINNPDAVQLKHQILNTEVGKDKDLLYDEETGIYFFVRNNNSIVEYNIESNITKLIYRSSENYIMTAVSDSKDTYWLLRNETDSEYCIAELNNSDLFMNFEKVPETPSGKFGTVIINNVLSFYNQTEVTNAFNHQVELSYSNHIIGSLTVVGISQYEDTKYIYYRNKTTLLLLNQNDSKILEFGNFHSISNFTEENGQLICGVSFTTNPESYYYPELNVISKKAINFMDKDEVGLTYEGSMDILNLSTYTQSFYQYNGNLSYVFSGSYISNSYNSFYFYTFNNSGHVNLKINVPKNQLFSPDGYFNFTVTGTCSFESNVSISGISMEGKNKSSYNMNLSSLNSGSYIYTLQILTGSLYYLVYTGTVKVDSSFPTLTFVHSIKNGVFSGEILWSKYYDSAGITRISVDGVNSTINYLNSTVSFFIPLYFKSEYIQFEISFRDKYNVSRSIKIKLKYYNEKGSGLFPDISQNQIFSSNKFNITLYGNGNNVSHILLVVRNGSFSKTLNFTSDRKSIHLNLSNGDYSLSTYDLFAAGNTVFEGTVNFTVLSENLRVKDNNTVKNFYSFYGNSKNDSFHFHFSANIEGIWTVKGYHDATNVFSEMVHEENLWLNSSGIRNIFRYNGTTVFYLNYSSINNHNYSSKLNINVNNSIPYFITKSYYYTNTSILNLSKAFSSNGRIYYYQNGKMREFNGSIYLNHSGNFSFKFTIWSSSMNHISHFIWIKFNTSTPEFRLNGFSGVLLKSPSLKLRVAPDGNSHISKVFLILNDREIIEKNLSFTIHFTQDGAYNFTLKIMDRCGNINTTAYFLNVTYYPLIRSIGVSYRMFFQSLVAQSVISGDNTSAMGIRWYINGNYVSSGVYENTSLPVGLDHVSIKVRYGNITKYYGFTVISLSSYFFIPLPIAVFAIYALRNFPVNTNSEALLNTIFSEDDSPLKEVIRRLRRKHFSRKLIRKSFNLLLERNLIKISPDPDGKPRLEILTNNKKK